MNYLLIALSAIYLLDAGANCRIYQIPSECNQFNPPCIWDSRGCVVGRHALEAKSGSGWSVFDNFDTSYELKKATAADDAEDE